jgi:hypothetical protein
MFFATCMPLAPCTPSGKVGGAPTGVIAPYAHGTIRMFQNQYHLNGGQHQLAGEGPKKIGLQLIDQMMVKIQVK